MLPHISEQQPAHLSVTVIYQLAHLSLTVNWPHLCSSAFELVAAGSPLNAVSKHPLSMNFC